MISEIGNQVFVETLHFFAVIASSTDETAPRAINPGFREVHREIYITTS